MEQYQIELADALERIAAFGRNREDFSFEMAYLPPDPDGGGMFTVQYEVRISNRNTSKNLRTIGGIGWNWVDRFEKALRDGHFD